MKEGRQEIFVKRAIEKEVRKSRKGLRGDSRKEEGKREIEQKKRLGERKGKNARVNTR